MVKDKRYTVCLRDYSAPPPPFPPLLPRPAPHLPVLCPLVTVSINPARSTLSLFCPFLPSYSLIPPPLPPVPLFSQPPFSHFCLWTPPSSRKSLPVTDRLTHHSAAHPTFSISLIAPGPGSAAKGLEDCRLRASGKPESAAKATGAINHIHGKNI